MNKAVYLLFAVILMIGALYLFSPQEQAQAMSLEEGIRLAREQNKLIFLYVTADWCGYCRLLDQEFKESEEFKKIIGEHYVWVTLDFDENPTVVSRFRLQGPPALIILDQNGEGITGIPGYPPNGVEDIILMLKEALK